MPERQDGTSNVTISDMVMMGVDKLDQYRIAHQVDASGSQIAIRLDDSSEYQLVNARSQMGDIARVIILFLHAAKAPGELIVKIVDLLDYPDVYYCTKSSSIAGAPPLGHLLIVTNNLFYNAIVAVLGITDVGVRSIWLGH